jgi:hypothetical protein
MKNHPLFPFASKLRPEIKNLDGPIGLQAFSEVLTVVYLILFAVVGVVWLVVAGGDLPSGQDILLLGLLGIAKLITNSQTAAIYLEYR